MELDKEHNRDLISVIIPTYRRSDSLERAIKSVLKQSYENVEIVVVDDNAEYPNERMRNVKLLLDYPEIKLVKNQFNMGGGLSRNEGVKVSKGRYLAFLDDDDEFLPAKLEQQYLSYKSSKDSSRIGVVYCHSEVICVDSTMYYWRRSETGSPLIAHIESCLAPSSALFVPRSAFLKVRGFEDISSRQDASFIMKLILAGYKVECTPIVLYRYHWHDGTNGITKVSKKSLDAEYEYRDLFAVYARNVGLSANVIDEANVAFSVRLIPILVRLHRPRTAWVEFVKAFRKRPYKKIVLLSLAKILGGDLYIKVSKYREKRARLGIGT